VSEATAKEMSMMSPMNRFYDAHSNAVLASFEGQDVYLPYGLGMLLFIPVTTDAFGSATVTYAITAEF
jgi:hypothetical protein